MTVVGIIPARGGSKGIPRKNITPFRGEPLIAHTINQASMSERLDAVYVSTDDSEIAAESESAGAEVIDRPAEIAGDRSPTEEALLHAVERLESDGTEPRIIVLLQCTSPLRRPRDIDETVRLVTEEGYDSALSCCEDHKFYWERPEDGAEPINYDPKNRAMRQELDRWYQENGSVYVTQIDVLRGEKCRLGGQIGIHVMPELLSFEIDTPEDLELVKAIAEVVSDEVPFAG